MLDYFGWFVVFGLFRRLVFVFDLLLLVYFSLFCLLLIRLVGLLNGGLGFDWYFAALLSLLPGLCIGLCVCYFLLFWCLWAGLVLGLGLLVALFGLVCLHWLLVCFVGFAGFSFVGPVYFDSTYLGWLC